MDKLIAAEKKLLNAVVPTLRGYHLALVGNQRPLSWLPKNRLHNFSISPQKNSSVLSHYETLPIRNNSIDIAFVPYELDNCEDPLALLHEIHRSLVSNGSVFIFAHQGLHPFNWFKPAFFAHSFFKLKHLLKLANFEYQKANWFHYGSTVLIQAKKQIPAMTPIKPQWEKKLVLDKQWQPTTRESS
jgi:ubiquinone/menaquinone biosynthesis C-methylase UbiE